MRHDLHYYYWDVLNVGGLLNSTMLPKWLTCTDTDFDRYPLSRYLRAIKQFESWKPRFVKNRLTAINYFDCVLKDNNMLVSLT